jgi:hypothetical protein
MSEHILNAAQIATARCTALDGLCPVDLKPNGSALVPEHSSTLAPLRARPSIKEERKRQVHVSPLRPNFLKAGTIMQNPTTYQVERDRLASQAHSTDVHTAQVSLAEIDALRIERERTLRRRAGWNMVSGFVLGALAVVVSLMVFAGREGSFQAVGTKVDGGVTNLSQKTGQAARQTGESVDDSLAATRK